MARMRTVATKDCLETIIQRPNKKNKRVSWARLKRKHPLGTATLPLVELPAFVPRGRSETKFCML